MSATTISPTTHLHGEYESNGDLVRCGDCHDVLGALCPKCEGRRKGGWRRNVETGRDEAWVCDGCGGWGWLKFPHAS